MNAQYVVVGALALVLVVGGTFFYLNDFELPGQSPTGNIVKDAFELSTGSDLEVMKVEEEGSLHRVVLSDGERVLNAYVTKDGQYIIQNGEQNLIHVENFMQTFEARNDFVACLSDQNAQFYGIIANNNEQLAQHTQMALIQFQVLGGQVGLQGIFQGPGTEGFPEQQVLENGVVWNLNGEMEAGLKTVPQLEEATGCEYNAPEQ